MAAAEWTWEQRSAGAVGQERYRSLVQDVSAADGVRHSGAEGSDGAGVLSDERSGYHTDRTGTPEIPSEHSQGSEYQGCCYRVRRTLQQQKVRKMTSAKHLTSDPHETDPWLDPKKGWIIRRAKNLLCK